MPDVLKRGGGTEGERNREFLIGLMRAFGGAIFFSLPLLMTMEMWWLGFYMDRFRLALFMVLMIPVLIGLDYYSGFEETRSWREDALDGIIGYGVGFAASAGILLLLNVIDLSMRPGEIIGKISLQAVPAGFGAVLASSQLGGGGGRRFGNSGRHEDAGFGAEVFFMVVGAVFLAFNLAPTEEIVLIAVGLTPGHGIAIVAVSLLMMHGFVYGASFRGTPAAVEHAPGWSLFLRFTVVGYAVALVISAYVLWTFGRLENGHITLHLMESIVLALPAGLGASAARLIL